MSSLNYLNDIWQWKNCDNSSWLCETFNFRKDVLYVGRVWCSRNSIYKCVMFTIPSCFENIISIASATIIKIPIPFPPLTAPFAINLCCLLRIIGIVLIHCSSIFFILLDFRYMTSTLLKELKRKANSCFLPPALSTCTVCFSFVEKALRNSVVEGFSRGFAIWTCKNLFIYLCLYIILQLSVHSWS